MFQSKICFNQNNWRADTNISHEYFQIKIAVRKVLIVSFLNQSIIFSKRGSVYNPQMNFVNIKQVRHGNQINRISL